MNRRLLAVLAVRSVMALAASSVVACAEREKQPEQPAPVPPPPPTQELVPAKKYQGLDIIKGMPKVGPLPPGHHPKTAPAAPQDDAGGPTPVAPPSASK